MGSHVTSIKHIEFRKYKKSGLKQQLVDIMGYISYLFTKNVDRYLFTKKECITVQLISTVQKQ